MLHSNFHCFCVSCELKNISKSACIDISNYFLLPERKSCTHCNILACKSFSSFYFFPFLFWTTPSSAKELFLALGSGITPDWTGWSYVVPWIQPRLTTYKARALPNTAPAPKVFVLKKDVICFSCPLFSLIHK